MATVTQGLVGRGLAPTKVNRFGLFGFVLHRGKSGAFMRTVTKGLVFTLAARAPKIGFACFNLNWKRRI